MKFERGTEEMVFFSSSFAILVSQIYPQQTLLITNAYLITQVQNDLTFGSVARDVRCSRLVHNAQEAYESNDVKHGNEVTYNRSLLKQL